MPFPALPKEYMGNFEIIMIYGKCYSHEEKALDAYLLDVSRCCKIEIEAVNYCKESLWRHR